MVQKSKLYKRFPVKILTLTIVLTTLVSQTTHRNHFYLFMHNFPGFLYEAPGKTRTYAHAHTHTLTHTLFFLYNSSMIHSF